MAHAMLLAKRATLAATPAAGAPTPTSRMRRGALWPMWPITMLRWQGDSQHLRNLIFRTWRVFGWSTAAGRGKQRWGTKQEIGGVLCSQLRWYACRTGAVLLVCKAVDRLLHMNHRESRDSMQRWALALSTSTFCCAGSAPACPFHRLQAMPSCDQAASPADMRPYSPPAPCCLN